MLNKVILCRNLNILYAFFFYHHLLIFYTYIYPRCIKLCLKVIQLLLLKLYVLVQTYYFNAGHYADSFSNLKQFSHFFCSICFGALSCLMIYVLGLDITSLLIGSGLPYRPVSPSKVKEECCQSDEHVYTRVMEALQVATHCKQMATLQYGSKHSTELQSACSTGSAGKERNICTFFFNNTVLAYSSSLFLLLCTTSLQDMRIMALHNFICYSQQSLSFKPSPNLLCTYLHQIVRYVTHYLPLSPLHSICSVGIIFSRPFFLFMHPGNFTCLFLILCVL